jgi:hypothetical protein
MALAYLPDAVGRPTSIDETDADVATVVCPAPDDFEVWNESLGAFELLTCDQRLRVVGILADLRSTSTPESGTVQLRQGSAGGTILWTADFDGFVHYTFPFESHGGLLLPASTNAVVVCSGAVIRMSVCVHQEPQ